MPWKSPHCPKCHVGDGKHIKRIGFFPSPLDMKNPKPRDYIHPRSEYKCNYCGHIFTDWSPPERRVRNKQNIKGGYNSA